MRGKVPCRWKYALAVLHVRMKTVEKDYSIEYRKVAEEFARRASERLRDRIRSITLFGSVARGQADPDSDIDILVVVDAKDPEITRSVYDVALDVELEHRAPLAVKVWAQQRVDQLSRMETPFMESIHAEGKTLWKRRSGSKSPS